MSGPIQSKWPVAGPVPLQRVPRQIEADVSLNGQDTKMHIEGDVFIGKRFLPAVVAKILKGSEDIRNVNLTFEPKTQRYAIKGEAKLAGIFWKAAGSTKAEMDGHDVVLRNVTFDFPGSQVKWLANKVRDGIVSGLNGQGIGAAREGNDIRISGNALLKEAGVPPQWATLSDNTAGKSSHDQEGNLTVHFGPGQAGTPDGVSHVKATLDPAAGNRVIKGLFGTDYQVKSTHFAAGTIKVKGSAPVPEIRDAVNGAIVVLAVLSGNARHLNNTNGMSEAPRINLDMDLRAEGSDVIIRPSLRAAVKKVATELAKGGAPVTATKDEVRVNAGTMLPEGRVHKIAITAEGLELEADLNVDAILSPFLR
ncbi:MAG: hypothetical protein H7338_12435 [Candidatus Sericytochromatia bacterium]|nr:hypothetical protein [Candidatus Sericytochromatia bacterium]